ncbi:MAG: hypothetical protein Q9162_006919 [Coniocarpon cinnabarinum]
MSGGPPSASPIPSPPAPVEVNKPNTAAKHPPIRGSLVASRNDKQNVSKANEETPLAKPKPAINPNFPKPYQAAQGLNPPSGQSREKRTSSHTGATTYRSDPRDPNIADTSLCPHGKVRPDPRRLTEHDTFVGHKSHDSANPNSGWAVAAKRTKEADAEYGRAVCQLCLADARRVTFNASSKKADQTTTQGHPDPGLHRADNEPASPALVQNDNHGSFSAPTSTVVSDVRDTSPANPLSPASVGQGSAQTDAVNVAPSSIATNSNPSNGAYDRRNISQRDIQSLSDALDSIIVEHGGSLKDITARLARELQDLHDPTGEGEAHTAPGSTGDSTVPPINSAPKHVTFAALPQPWRPEHLEQHIDQLSRLSHDTAFLIEEIEREIGNWSAMMAGQWNGGTGSVVSETAMETQQERAAAVGLWAPHGVPRPLRANTASRPSERAGWTKDEDGAVLARRPTLYFDSEEWPGVGEGSGDV